jgi:hypothetical protein
MLMNRALGRRLVPIFLLMVLALIRADRGMAELQGHAAEPSRLFHVAPAPDGSWDLTVMGFDRRIPRAAEVLTRTRSQASLYLEHIMRALP